MHIFSGIFKGRQILSPKGLKTRPTSGRLREALFNICQGCEGARFLDLFAGSGAMGLEALSRGAKSVVFVDNSRESIRCIQANIKALGVENRTEVLYGDVFDVLLKLAKTGKTFEIIYADPPYEQLFQEGAVGSFSAQVLEIVDENAAQLLGKDGDLFLEDSAKAVPNSDHLISLKMKSSRIMGRSALQNYIRIA